MLTNRFFFKSNHPLLARMSGESFNCQMEVAFHDTPEGRPEIYDFVWEHLPKLVQKLDEKKIRLHLRAPYAVFPQKKSTQGEEINHLVQKIVNDRRFSTHTQSHAGGGTLSLDMDIPTKELDHVLNAYNVFVDRFLPAIHLEGKKIHVDFSPAEENKVRMHIHSNQKPLVNTFFVQSCTRPPSVRSIIFDSPRRR